MNSDAFTACGTASERDLSSVVLKAFGTRWIILTFGEKVTAA